MTDPRAESIRARLLNRARQQGEDFNLLLTRYALERWLYRLSVSDEKKRLRVEETVIAEKFEAMVTLGIRNSRMKDYFDLWVLLQGNKYGPALLAQAIRATFERRGTTLSSALPIGLTAEFAEDGGKLMQWQAFLRKNHLEAPELADVVAVLRTALAQSLDEARRQSA